MSMKKIPLSNTHGVHWLDKYDTHNFANRKGCHTEDLIHHLLDWAMRNGKCQMKEEADENRHLMIVHSMKLPASNPDTTFFIRNISRTPGYSFYSNARQIVIRNRNESWQIASLNGGWGGWVINGPWLEDFFNVFWKAYAKMLNDEALKARQRAAKEKQERNKKKEKEGRLKKLYAS